MRVHKWFVCSTILFFDCWNSFSRCVYGKDGHGGHQTVLGYLSWIILCFSTYKLYDFKGIVFPLPKRYQFARFFQAHSDHPNTNLVRGPPPRTQLLVYLKDLFSDSMQMETQIGRLKAAPSLKFCPSMHLDSQSDVWSESVTRFCGEPEFDVHAFHPWDVPFRVPDLICKNLATNRRFVFGRIIQLWVYIWIVYSVVVESYSAGAESNKIVLHVFSRQYSVLRGILRSQTTEHILLGLLNE